jgi:TrmH family RNA methyltransferase
VKRIGTAQRKILLKSFPERVLEVFATQNWTETRQGIVKNLTQLSIINDDELKKISQLTTPNEVLALVSKPSHLDKIDLLHGITVMLDEIQDPGNLGTIIRSCDWFGVKNIVCSPRTVDAFNTKVIQASMGSIMRINIFYEELMDVIDQFKTIPLYAAELSGQSIFDFNFTSPAILVIGNEARGVSPNISLRSTHKVSIPRYGNAESLNAAVATSIILSSMTK